MTCLRAFLLALQSLPLLFAVPLSLHAQGEPDSSTIATLLAKARDVADRDLHETIWLCTKVLSMDSLTVEAYWYRGVAHGFLDHYEEALADFRRITMLEPDYANAYGMCGANLLLLGRLEESRAFCERAYGLDSMNADWPMMIGHTYMVVGDTLTAHRYYREGLRLTKSDNEFEERLLPAFRKLAKVQGRKNIFEREMAWAREEYSLIQMGHLDAARWQVMMEDVDSLFLAGRYREAGPVAERALRTAEVVFGTRDSNTAFSMSYLAEVRRAQGQLAGAESLLIRAIDITEVCLGPQHPQVATSATLLAKLYEDECRYAEAESLVRRGLAIREGHYGPEDRLVGSSLNDLAILCASERRYVEVEALYKRALAIFEKTDGANSRSAAITTTNLGGFYIAQARYAEAESLYRRALDVYELTLPSYHPDFALMLGNMGLLYKTLGRYPEAEKYYDLAVASLEEGLGDQHPMVANLMNSAGNLYVMQGRYASGEALLNKACRIYEEVFGLDHPSIASPLHSLAMLHKDQARYLEAEQFATRSIKILEKNFGDGHPNVARALSILAEIREVHGYEADADSLYIKSNDILLDNLAHQFPALSEGEREVLYRTVQSEFEWFVPFALRRAARHPAILGDILNNQLARKGLLVSSTIKVNQHIRRSGDTVLIKDFLAWRSMRQYLAKVRSISRDEQRAKGIDVGSLDQTVNDLERDLSRRSEEFGREFESKAIAWTDVQSKLASDEAAIDIVRFRADSSGCGDSVCYAALILTQKTKAHPDVVVLKSGSLLEGKYQQLYRRITPLQGTPRGATPSELRSLPKDEAVLYNAYWAPIQAALEGIRRVYFCVDGVYNTINVESLRMPTGKYIGEEFEIVLVTNLRDLMEDRSKTMPRNNVAELFGYPKYDLGAKEQSLLAEGFKDRTVPGITGYSRGEPIHKGRWNPLLGTKLEVECIDSLLRNAGWQTRTHIGAQALEEAVKSVDNPRVLHIATHGFFQEDLEPEKNARLQYERTKEVMSPLFRSGLGLAGADRASMGLGAEEANLRIDDGILTAYEAMNLDLDRTELVVLSACETGLGDVKNGEGVYGLRRALQVAGARYVLMSLWPVADEATRMLMRLFYANWVKEGDVRAAFRDAQHALRTDYPSPKYWAAFVIVGV